MATANAFRMVADVAYRFMNDINRYVVVQVKATAEGTLYGFLIKYSFAMKITGLSFLIVGLWNPFWYMSLDISYGLSTTDKASESGNVLNSFYKSGLMWWVRLYETVGLLLAAGSVISLLEKYFSGQLIIGKFSRVCSMLDGPFLLAGCVIFLVQPMKADHVIVSLLLTCMAGFLLLPSGMLEIRELLKKKE